MLRCYNQEKKEIDHSKMQDGGGGGLKYQVDKLVDIYKNYA